MCLSQSGGRERGAGDPCFGTPMPAPGGAETVVTWNRYALRSEPSSRPCTTVGDCIRSLAVRRPTNSETFTAFDCRSAIERSGPTELPPVRVAHKRASVHCPIARLLLLPGRAAHVHLVTTPPRHPAKRRQSWHRSRTPFPGRRLTARPRRSGRALPWLRSGYCVWLESHAAWQARRRGERSRPPAPAFPRNRGSCRAGFPDRRSAGRAGRNPRNRAISETGPRGRSGCSRQPETPAVVSERRPIPNP